MATIPRIYLDCVFYVYPNRSSAEKGERAGGTGFLCAKRHGITDQVFLVTNRHVVEPMEEPHIRLNLRESAGVEVVRIPKSWWHKHSEGDDLSVAQVDLSAEKYRIAWVYDRSFIDDHILKQENVGLGDSVAMLGRFSSHDGKLQNSPSARFGHIAMLAADPIENDFGHLQETIVIECFSLKGYSGSPVFWFRRTTAISDDAIMNSRCVYLLGVNWMHFEEKQSVTGGGGSSGESFVRDHTGMSGLIPAWRLSKLLSTFDPPASVNADIQP
jgi:hypothetical protein